MKLTYEQIQPYIEKGLVSEQCHPDDPYIRIFNYTQRVQFSKAWDDVTERCRGLIIDIRTNKYLANPFPKFFNYGEREVSIPDERPVISEKMDGSLGILYWLKGEPWIATRGSFTSDQALWATHWLRHNMSDIAPLTDDGMTHLFEIIYPENRIVVTYPFEGLVYLGSRYTDSGLELMMPFSEQTFRRPHTIKDGDLETLKTMDAENQEGFVIFYPSAGLRLKIKFPEYVRLHRLITGFSSKSIWECLMNGQDIEKELERVPDEFFAWVRKVENELRAKFAALWGEAQMAVQMVHGKPNRKEQAIEVMAKYKKVAGAVFSLLDGEEKRAVQGIWRMLKPKFELPFKSNE